MAPSWEPVGLLECAGGPLFSAHKTKLSGQSTSSFKCTCFLPAVICLSPVHHDTTCWPAGLPPAVDGGPLTVSANTPTLWSSRPLCLPLALPRFEKHLKKFLFTNKSFDPRPPTFPLSPFLLSNLGYLERHYKNPIDCYYWCVWPHPAASSLFRLCWTRFSNRSTC